MDYWGTFCAGGLVIVQFSFFVFLVAAGFEPTYLSLLRGRFTLPYLDPPVQIDYFFSTKVDVYTKYSILTDPNRIYIDNLLHIDILDSLSFDVVYIISIIHTHI